MDLNKVTLIGNLVREPANRTMPSGQMVTTFDIATNYSWRDNKTKKKKDTVEYHNVVAWGRLAEIIAEYVKKGSKVYIEGRLRHRTWKDKEGKNKKITEVIADNLIMLGHQSAKEKTPDAFAKEEADLEVVPA
ncbi:MAG: single-stranded DNA-binding protein [Patescibacteria group bacterium]